MDAARELAQLLERVRELVARPREQVARTGRVALDLALGKPQEEGDRDEPLLRAVVQVPLETAPLGARGLDDARAGTPELLLVALPLGDVHPGDQPARLASLVHEGRHPPGDDQA